MFLHKLVLHFLGMNIWDRVNGRQTLNTPNHDSQTYEICCYNAVSENGLDLRMAFSNSIKGQLLSLSRATAIAIEGEQGANLGDEKLRLGFALSVGRGRSRVRDTCGKSHLDCTRIMSETSMTSANPPP